MNNTSEPADARGLSPRRGWIHDGHELPEGVESDDYVLVVSSEGRIRGVQPHDRAPLVAVLRIEGDLTEIVGRIDQLADRIAGLDTGLAVDVSMLEGRVRQLENRREV